MAQKATVIAVIIFAIVVFTWARVDAMALQQAPGQTVLEGVYTEDQAMRGHEQFSATCARCHEGICPDGPPLVGPMFIERWREDSLGSLLSFMKGIPRVQGGVLDESGYVDVIAYLLQANAYSSGSKELTAASAGNIQLVGKNGPKPLPINALVEVVGCFVKESAEVLKLTRASDPARIHRGNDSTAEEIAAAAGRPAGALTFQLQNIDEIRPGFNADSIRGRKLLVKGVLGRQGAESRIFVTSFEALTATCTP